MSEKNFWEDAPIAEPAKKPEPNFWEQASIADVVAPVVPQPVAPPVETPVPNAVDRAVLRQPILPLLTGQKQPPLGKPSVRPARLGDTVVKPAFDFTDGKTGAVNDAFTRAWTGETQADLIGDLSSNMAEQARILSDPDYASKGPGIFNPGQQRNGGAAWNGMGGINWTVPVVTPSPSERLAVLQASRKNIIAKLRETKAILDNAQGSTQGMEDFKKAEGGWDTAGTLALNLFPIIAQGAAESSVVSAKAAVAGAATAALAGLTGGSSLVVQGAGLLGGALMTGMESYDSKLMESLIEYGNKTGVDILSDPEGWYKAAMKDPKNFEKVYNETNIQAARVGLTEGAATGVLGGLNKFIPGGEKLVSKLLIGAAKGAGEEMGTLFATNTVEGKENTLKDYALAGTLGATLDAGGDAFTTGVGKLFTGSTPAAAPAPAPPPPAPAAPAPAPLVPGAGVVPPVAAPVAPAAGPVAPVEAAPVQPVADLKQMEVDVGLARDAEEQAAKRLEAVAGQEFPDEQLLARMQAELADASATFQAAELAFKQEQERQLAPQPVAPRQPAPVAPATAAPANRSTSPGSNPPPAPIAPTDQAEPASQPGNVPPAPVPLTYATNGKNVTVQENMAWMASMREWEEKYGKTHNQDGTPLSAAPVAPAAPAKPASSFTAGLREDAAKLRGQRPAVPPTPAATATIPPAAPVATANVPPAPPVAAAANEPAAPATPPRTAAASPQPTPAPGANRASFDPQADPRWENLYRDQQKKIRELTAERDNVSQRRDRESRQGRSTKQSEKRLNTINTQIEEVLAQSQPRPEPVARPARQPAAPAAPVADVPVDEPAAPVEPEGIVKAKAEAAEIKDQLDKLEASGQGRTPQATKLRNRFNERKQDITRYENKNKLPLTYPPQARAGVASTSSVDSGPVWAAIDMDNEAFAYDDALWVSRMAAENSGMKIEWDTSLNPLVAGLDSVENYRQNQRPKAAAEKQLKRLIAIAEKRFPGIVDLVTSEGYKPNDTDTKAEILAEPHILAGRILREVNRNRFRGEANAQTDTQSERAAEPVAQDEPVTQAEPVANDQPAEPVAPVATEAKPDPAAEEDGPMPSDAEIEQELARIENDKAAQEQEARDAQAEEPAHVATFREAYDNLRDDLEGAAQEQSTADKQVNGKNGIITKADVLLEGAADMDPKEFARQARDIADKAESFAEDQQEKSDNIENAGREDTFDGRGSMIDGLNDLATNLREAADLADPKATTESTPAATVNPQLARIDKQLDTGTITREEHAELKQKIMGEPAAQAATSETVETPPDIADVAANDPKQTAQLELWADKTLRQARKNFNSGIDPTVLLAAAFKVAYMSARGIKKVTDITAALVKEYGEPIRQHIKDIIAKAKDPKLKAEVLDIIEAERPTGPLTPKQAEAARRSFKPVKLSVYEFGYKSNGKDKTVNAYGATMKEARSRAIASVASKLEIPASSVRLKGGKIVGNFEGFAVKPGVFDLDELPQVTKAPTTRLGWRKLFNAAGRAAAHAFSREDKGVATEGWQESLAIVKHGSSSGIIPPAPLQLHEWIKDPSSFRRFVEDAAKKNPQLIKSALEGLASLKDAHEAAARGAIPPEMVASHMAWGLLSRMLDPYNQEAGWIRLFNNEAVVNAIVDSVNGEFKMTKDEWKALVKSSMEKAEGETPAGRGATSNANAFHAMLEKWNGRWTELADIVNKSGGNVIKMRQAFFEQGFSGAGIKHKVLSFTLATLATMKPVVLDRWQVVNYWMPHLIEAARNMPLEDGSTDVFTFDKNGVPEDRTKAYALIGGLLNDNAVAEASYQIIENALLHIAEQNKEWLNPMFGLGPNEVVEPFKMHWLTWNIGKNEPVGHSSLDSTTFALKNNLYGKPDFAKRFAELNKKTERYTPQGDFEVFSASSDQRPTVSRRAAETDAGEASFSQQKDEGGGQDGPVRSGVTTPTGDVANHGDADLAKRGFITNEATKMPADLAGVKLVIKQEEVNGDYSYYKGELRLEGRKIAEFNYNTNAEFDDVPLALDWIEVQKKHRGKELSKVIQAEIIERAKRAEKPSSTYYATVMDPKQRPIKGMQSLLGKDNVRITETAYEQTDGKDAFRVPMGDGTFIKERREVEATIPNQYTPEQRQLIQNIKDAVAAGADEKTILGHIDAWAKSTLPPGRLLSFGPQEFAALAWQTGRTSVAALGSFAQWSKQMVQTYGPKVKSFLKQIWIDSKAIRQNAFDFATVRYLASRADKIWQNADRNPQSPTLRKLANLLHTKDGTEATGELSSIPQRIREERIKFANAFARISEQFASEFLKMDKAARQQWDEDFRDYVLGNKKPTDPKVAKAVAEYRQLMGELLAFQRDAGIEMGDQGGNYFPRVYSPEAIDADLPGFLEAATEMYRQRDARLGNPIKSDAEYASLANAWAFRIQNGNVDQVQLNSAAMPEQSEMPSSTKSREFTEDEAALADKYLSKDIERITLSYIGRATKAAEVARAFGPKGEKFTAMIAQLGQDKVPMDTIEETAGLVRRTLGYGIERHSKAAAAVIDWSNAVVAAGFLGFSFVNNVLLEPVSYGVRTGNPLLGLRAVAETWAGTIRVLSRGDLINKPVKALFGTRVAMAEAFNEAMAEQLGLLQREMEHSFMDAHWNYMEEKGSPAARWVIQSVQKANLMQQTEHAKVAASVGIARLAVRDNVRFMMGQAPIQKFFKKLGMDVTAPGSSKIILNENGVPEAEHQAFAEFVMGLEGKNDAAYQAAIMSNDRMAFLYRQAIQRMSNGMSIKANQALKMDSSDKLEGKMMMQLMNYSYAYANLVKDAMYNKAMAAGTGSRSQITMLDRARLAVPLLVGGTLSVIAAEAGKQLINEIWPTEGTEKREELPWWRKILDSASYAGMFGPKVEFVAKLVNRGQFPVGPSLDAGGKTLAAAGGMVADSDSAQRSAKKQIYNAGVKPVVVGGASAVHPFLGFMANQAMRQESVRDAFIGEKPQ